MLVIDAFRRAIARTLLALLTVAALVPNIATAGLIVYDPFPTGTEQDAADRVAYVPGISLGHGAGATNRSVGFTDDPWGGEGTWSGHWVRGGPWTVAEDAFDTYVSGNWQIATSGGSVYYSGVAPGDTGGATHRRISSSADAYTSGTLYFSFLSHWHNFDGIGGSNGFGLGKESPNNNGSYVRFQPVNDTDGQQGEFRLGGAAGSSGFAGPLDAGVTYFFVGQYVLVDDPTFTYTLSVWVNPDLDALQSGMPLDDLDSSQYLHKLETSNTQSTIRPVDFWHMSPNNDSSETYEHLFDELRFGTTQESVLAIEFVPEPASAVLAILGIAGVISMARIRRRAIAHVGSSMRA